MPPHAADWMTFAEIQQTIPSIIISKQQKLPLETIALSLARPGPCSLPDELLNIVLQFLKPFMAKRLKTYRGHTGPILCLNVFRNHLFSGSDDTTIRMWQTNGRCLKVLSGHRAAVRCMTTWNQRLLSGSADGSVRFWDPKEDEMKALITGHGPVLCMATLKDKLFTGSVPGDVRMWNTKGELIKEMNGHRGTVWCLTSFGDNIYSGSTDGVIRMWNAEGEPVREMLGHRETVCALIGLNNTLCSLSLGSTIRLWTAAGDFMAEINCGRDRCLTELNGKLVSGSVDRNLRVWDLDSKRMLPPRLRLCPNRCVIKEVKAHEGPVLCVAGAGRYLFSGSEDGVITLWA